jgi:hypothetical protein
MQLSPDGHGRVKALVLLCQHYEEMLTHLRARLVEVIQDELGIDLDKDNYTLDVEKGEVTKGEQNAKQPG